MLPNYPTTFPTTVVVSMRAGWSDKDAGVVLGVATPKVSQALVPALTKVARLMRVDAMATMKALLETADDLDPMTPAEMDLRERMLTGRANRDEVHPCPARSAGRH